jgi:hypothetical protein
MVLVVTFPTLTPEALRDTLEKHPEMTAVQIAAVFGVSRQWVSQLAKKEGLRLAGTQRRWVEGL